ncbi:cytochrome P450 [Nocardia flavorosea]|uniref:Cytochrome P450 n=1 Tax=Nocardia flavorosea TaxID=53429 RepID=A0A846YJT7_9NOCA|nr:cytochrome P450 [Nocardia flavorosea]NKY57920.1 cytochrome P450 [Nocardia flavorosea]
MTGQSRPASTQRRGSTVTPTDSTGSRIPLYSREFATDPHGFYQWMRRRYGAVAPVDLAPGVPATLVVDDRTARRILDDADHFPSDPRGWQQKAPAGLPIVPMMQWRPNPLRTHGPDHDRYRAATVDALAGVDPNSLRTTVSRIALDLINRFCSEGAADLLDRYVVPLVFRTMDDVLGCPTELGDRLRLALTEMIDGAADDGAEPRIQGLLAELIAGKRTDPGDDVTSRLIRHPANLSDEELVHQLLGLYWTGLEPPRNLIANTLLLTLTDPRFTSDHTGFAPPARDALDEVLANDPPLANHSISYPPLPVMVDDVLLPADQPVLIGAAACHGDPDRSAAPVPHDDRDLAWGRGAHACPAHARTISRLLAEEAIEQLLDALPDLTLAFDPDRTIWRPGPFHRALIALPVRFPPAPGMPLG